MTDICQSSFLAESLLLEDKPTQFVQRSLKLQGPHYCSLSLQRCLEKTMVADSPFSLPSWCRQELTYLIPDLDPIHLASTPPPLLTVFSPHSLPFCPLNLSSSAPSCPCHQSQLYHPIMFSCNCILFEIISFTYVFGSYCLSLLKIM